MVIIGGLNGYQSTSTFLLFFSLSLSPSPSLSPSLPLPLSLSLSPFPNIITAYPGTWTPMRFIWLGAFVFATCYNYFWDILMDWDLGKPKYSITFSPHFLSSLYLSFSLSPSPIHLFLVLFNLMIPRFVEKPATLSPACLGIPPSSLSLHSPSLPSCTNYSLFRCTITSSLQICCSVSRGQPTSHPPRSTLELILSFLQPSSLSLKY